MIDGRRKEKYGCEGFAGVKAGGFGNRGRFSIVGCTKIGDEFIIQLWLEHAVVWGSNLRPWRTQRRMRERSEK